MESSSVKVPAPRYTTTEFVFPLDGTGQERRTEIDLIASQLSTQSYVTLSGHYQAPRFFRPVEYRAVAIPAELLTARKVREFAWRS